MAPLSNAFGRVLAVLVVFVAGVACSSRESSNAEADVGSHDTSDGWPAPPDAPTALTKVSLHIGERAFNESANTGFDKSVVVAWSADVTCSSTGRFTAKISTKYDGPPITATAIRDVLFWRVAGTYVYSPTYDSMLEPLSPTRGVLAQISDARSASFTIDDTFSVPALAKSSDMWLEVVHVDLTWVRVYRTGTAIDFHVLPSESTASFAWNAPSPPLAGTFGYYVPISESRATGDDFDYPTWIRKNVTW